MERSKREARLCISRRPILLTGGGEVSELGSDLLAAKSSLVLCICTCTLYTWGFSHLQQAPRSPGEPGAGASCQRGPSQEPLFSLWAWASIAPPNHGEVMSGPFVVAEVYSVETRPNTRPRRLV